MKTKRTGNSNYKKPKGINKTFSQLAILAIIIAFLVLFFFWHQGNFNTINDQKLNSPDTKVEDISVPDQISAPIADKSDTISSENQSLTPTEIYISEKDQENDPAIPQDQNEGSISENPSIEEGPDPAETQVFNKICSDSGAIIKQFYQHLDTQDYMKAYDLNSSSEVYFNRLIQKLLNNPPIVSGEMNDLFTILQNTAHFFRVIGKNNILILKGILDREKGQFEEVLSQFFTLLLTPDCPKQIFSLSVKETSLYDYAGFFLNTMGGRLYLFRRDSMSRMVVSYYSILLIDQANKNANNQHGIEIVTSIDQLISEMESTSNTLVLKESYLDRLYSLKEKYQ